MDESQAIPIPGIILAVIATLGLIALGLDFALAIAVLIIWVGTLFLAASRPPQMAQSKSDGAVTRDAIGELIEHAHSPLLVTDRNKVALANRTARRVLGSHIIGQDLRVVFRQPDAVALFDANRNGGTIIRGLVRRQDIWRLNRQGVSETMAVVELTNQTAEADISRAHTDFVANASHELRTPLASIIGYVETLQEDVESLDRSTATRFLKTIRHEAERMRNLVSDLMSLSRVEAEKHDSPKERIDLAPLIMRAAHDAAGTERASLLDFQLAENVLVLGDTQQLEQLVRNLIDNGLKYGKPESPVSISLSSSDGGQALITVADRGDGIPAEHLPHLTRRFYRTDPGRSRASGGTGLGLAIVKHIVERHRGRMEISSETGVGTNVTVRLPQLAQG